MRVVVDTNVVISGTFFGGNPRRVIEAVVDREVDARALYIVSGDKDLLDLKSFGGVEIVTATEFCERYL